MAVLPVTPAPNMSSQNMTPVAANTNMTPRPATAQTVAAPVSPTPRPPASAPAVVTSRPAAEAFNTQAAAVNQRSAAVNAQGLTAQQMGQFAGMTGSNPGGTPSSNTGGVTSNSLAAPSGARLGADGTLVSNDGGNSWVRNPALSPSSGSTSSSPTTPTTSSRPTSPSGSSGVTSNMVPLNAAGTGLAEGWVQTGRDAAGNALFSKTSPAPTPAAPATQTPEDKAIASLNASNAKLQTAQDEYNTKMNQILNGTYPLNDAQKAQLNNIGQRFEGLIAMQKEANAAYEQGVRVSGIAAGRSMYAPEIELGNIKGAIDQGIAKIGEIDMQMQTTLLAAKQAIQDDNVKLLDKTYQNLMKFEEQKQKSIGDLYNLTTKSITDARQRFKDEQAEIDSMAELAKPPESIDQSLFSKMDAQREKLGLATYNGYTKDLYTLQYQTAADKKKQTDAAAEMKRATDLFTILDKTGGSGTVTVGDHTYTYQGRNAANFASGTEMDKSGRLMGWERNLTTGTIRNFDLGITKPEEGWATQKMNDGTFWAVNAKTGESKPIFASDGRKAWDEGVFATGKVGPALPGSKNAGQCGAMNNYFYGKAVVGDSLQSKLDPLRPFAVKNQDDVRAGMSFVQDIGSNGHIGFVESKGIDPTNGRAYITTFETNYGLDGRIGHGRKIYLDDPTLKMISDYPAPNLPKVGPGATPQVLRDSPEEDKPLSASEIKSYRDMGYDVTPGMTLADVKQQKPAQDVTETSFEDFRKGLEQASGMSLPLSTVQAAYKQEVESLKPIKQAIGVIAATAPSVAAGKQMVSSVTEALERGDTEGVKQLLKASAITSLPTAEQTKVRGREVGIQTLDNIEKLLNDYKAAGGETGIVSGTEAEMLEKIGRIKDPQKKAIATQIRSALIDYRSAVSGAAFTESEMQEYKGLFPSVSSSYDLNLAKIDGLRKAWRQGNDATFRTIMTPSLYDSIYK